MAYEPAARVFHAALSLGQNMFVLAGKGCEGSSVESSVVERFNVTSMSWQQPRPLYKQCLPDGYRCMAVASDGENSYMFGGFVGSRESRQRCNAIYEINMVSFKCTELIPATAATSPRARSSCGMVCVNRTLVVYGGAVSDGISTDELFVFDLNTKMWTIQAATGEKPPALCAYTLVMIDKNKAALFGGWSGRKMHNDTYVLDMDIWHWSKLKTSGKKPPARLYPTTSVLTGHRTHIAVIGGEGVALSILSDMWLLDMTNGTWSEVMLPPKITPRQGHSAVVFGSGPNLRVIVFFGGSTTTFTFDAISETTLLLLAWKNGSWVVERMVGAAELCVPDHTLKEQISRLFGM